MNRSDIWLCISALTFIWSRWIAWRRTRTFDDYILGGRSLGSYVTALAAGDTVTVLDGSAGTPGTAAGGWFYNANTGDIKANLADAEKDQTGKNYNAY